MADKRQVIRWRALKDPVKLGKRTFRKQMLSYGEFLHEDAPDGKLKVDRSFCDRIVDNFRKGMRDTVPIPLGHTDGEGTSSVGRVLDLEVDDDGLWGLHLIEDEEKADKLGRELRDSSVLVEPDFLDIKTGNKVGPVLIHNAITNAARLTGLRSWEAVSFGDDASKVDVIDFANQSGSGDSGKGEKMTIAELLEKAAEVTDADFAAELAKSRPKVVETLTEDAKVDEDALRAEGAAAVVADLKTKGITYTPTESKGKDDGKGEAKAEAKTTGLDISEHPDFKAINKTVNDLMAERTKTETEAKVDAAIREGRVLPAEKEGLVAVGLSDGTLLENLLKTREPAKAVAFGEVGFATTTPPTPAPAVGGAPSVDDPDAEAKRYLGMAKTARAST